MGLSLYQTLIIGLGGTGHRTVCQIRKLMADRIVEMGWPFADRVPEAWQFLVLDAIEREKSARSAEAMATGEIFTDPYSISEGDYINLSANTHQEYLSSVLDNQLGAAGFQRRFPDLAKALMEPNHLRPYLVASRVKRQAIEALVLVDRHNLKAELVKRFEILGRPESIGSLVQLQRLMGIPDWGGTDPFGKRVFIVGSSIGATGSVLMLELLDLVREAHRAVFKYDCDPSLVVFPSDAFEFPWHGIQAVHSENERAFLSRLDSLHQFQTPPDKRPRGIYFLPRASLADWPRSSTRPSDGREAISVASEFIASVSMGSFSPLDHLEQDWFGPTMTRANNPQIALVSSFGFVKLAIGRQHLTKYIKALLMRLLVEKWAGATNALGSPMSGLDTSDPLLQQSLGCYLETLTSFSAPIPSHLLPLEHEFLLEGPELWPDLTRALLEQSCTQPMFESTNPLNVVAHAIIEGGFPLLNQPDDVAPPLEFTRLQSLTTLDDRIQSWLMRPGSVTQRYVKEGLGSFLRGDQLLDPSNRADQLETRRRAFREKLQIALDFPITYYSRFRYPNPEPMTRRWLSAIPAGLSPDAKNIITQVVRNAFETYAIGERDSDTESISLYGVLTTLATPRPPIGIRKN